MGIGPREHNDDEEVLSTREKIEHLYELIDGIEIAMLTTRDSDGALVSRPMATQEHAANGALWFMTNIETHKLDEISGDARVNLAYYKDRTREFVSVSGWARVTQERARIRELYRAGWRMWLGDEGGLRDGGPEDPRIALIEVTPQSATYLKVDRPQPIVLFNLLKGMLTGEHPQVGEMGKLDRAELAQGKPPESRPA
jgi:general stress protein 26